MLNAFKNSKGGVTIGGVDSTYYESAQRAFEAGNNQLAFQAFLETINDPNENPQHKSIAYRMIGLL